MTADALPKAVLSDRQAGMNVNVRRNAIHCEAVPTDYYRSVDRRDRALGGVMLPQIRVVESARATIGDRPPRASPRDVVGRQSQ